MALLSHVLHGVHVPEPAMMLDYAGTVPQPRPNRNSAR